MTQTGDDATIIQAVEMIGNDAVVLGSIPVTGKGTYRISFQPTGSSVQLWVLGAYDMQLKPTCYTYPVTTQETYLVDICDENKDRYRFGFNGQEKDNELKGIGNSLDFGARMYDSRVGRWLSLDPLAQKYPSISSYVFVANSPIIYIDPDGKKITFSNKSDASLYHQNLNNMLPGPQFDDFKKLLTRGTKGNKLAFDKIDNKMLEAAIQGLNPKEQHLTRLYAEAINSDRNMIVNYYGKDDKITGRDYEMLYNKFTDNKRSKEMVQTMDAMKKTNPVYNPATGDKIRDDDYFMGTVILSRGAGFTVEDGNDIRVFLYKEDSGVDVAAGHETIGHGIPLMRGGYSLEQNEDHAVKTENLIRDVSGKGNPIDGTTHNLNSRPTANPTDLPK